MPLYHEGHLTFYQISYLCVDLLVLKLVRLVFVQINIKVVV